MPLLPADRWCSAPMARSSEVSIDRPRRRFSGRGGTHRSGRIVPVRADLRPGDRPVLRRLPVRTNRWGAQDVFWRVITATLTLFGVFFALFAVIAGINLWIADRVAPVTFPANVHPYVERFHDLFGTLACWCVDGIVLVFALLPARFAGGGALGRTGCCSATPVSSASPMLHPVPTCSTSSCCRSWRSCSIGCSLH